MAGQAPCHSLEHLPTPLGLARRFAISEATLPQLSRKLSFQNKLGQQENQVQGQPSRRREL